MSSGTASSSSCLATDLLKGGSRELAEISSGCSSIDKLIGGGFSAGILSEIAGEAGTGKTTLALQLLLQAQLPIENGGLNAKACYITTEGTSLGPRLLQLATDFVKKNELNGKTRKDLLDGIFIEKAFELEEQIDTLQCRLPLLLEERNVRLVILDSVAGIFRNEMTDSLDEIQARSKLMFGMANCMRILSAEYNAVFIVVNQVTGMISKVSSSSLINQPKVKPALGLAWSSCVNQRILLSKSNSSASGYNPIVDPLYAPGSHEIRVSAPVIRVANLVFSPRCPSASSYFTISQDGFNSI